MEATAVADVEPFAVLATAFLNVFRPLIDFTLLVVIAEAAAGHHIACGGNGKEIVLTVTAEHAAFHLLLHEGEYFTVVFNAS